METKLRTQLAVQKALQEGRDAVAARQLPGRGVRPRKPDCPHRRQPRVPGFPARGVSRLHPRAAAEQSSRRDPRVHGPPADPRPRRPVRSAAGTHGRRPGSGFAPAPLPAAPSPPASSAPTIASLAVRNSAAWRSGPPEAIPDKQLDRPGEGPGGSFRRQQQLAPGIAVRPGGPGRTGIRPGPLCRGRPPVCPGQPGRRRGHRRLPGPVGLLQAACRRRGPQGPRGELAPGPGRRGLAPPWP